MTITIKDLWPMEFSPQRQTPPVTILRQQAALLGRKTKNLVEGDVVTSTTAEGMFEHTFYFVAPALDDFRYRALKVVHGIVFYPLELKAGKMIATCNDEDEFTDILQYVFAAEETHNVIASLIAQSTS